MAEYINREDALKIIDSYSKACTEEGKVVADAIRDIIAVITPTADVVPKSEVDKWKEINEQLHKEMSERMIAERKIERNLAVLQIIGEILSRHTPDTDGFLTIHKAELAELKKKYGGDDESGID